MSKKWTIVDHTDGSKGWLQITFDGKRVADAFPYASAPHHPPPEWVREQVQNIVDAMNDMEWINEQRAAQAADPQ